MCARCEELEEEVAYLRSELGVQQDATDRALLRKALSVRPAVIDLLLSLSRAKGRIMSVYQLMEGRQTLYGAEDDPEPGIIKVYICHARKLVGKDGIETDWGRGYRLTERGLTRFASILAQARQVAA